ncbi:anti-sigma factor RsbA family regulatory protein [Spirillospora sp. NPDC127200]
MKSTRPLGGSPAGPEVRGPSGSPHAAPVDDRRHVLAHRALLYRSGREFAVAAERFLRAGPPAGEVTVAITSPGVAEILRARLGLDAAPVEFLDAASWYRSPVRTMAEYYERTARDWWPQGRLRLLAEPVWSGRSPLERLEWLRHEALINEALAGTPTTMVCAFDARSLPAEVVAGAARTHPELLDGGTVRASAHFTDPADFYAECNGRPLEPPPLSAARRAFAAGELPTLRAFLSAEAARLDLPEDRMLPFVLAVNEVATVIIREGGGYGAVWVWSCDSELLCDITAPEGHLPDHFLGHLQPYAHRQVDAAFWAVRRLCHIVEIRTGEGSAGGVGFRGHDAGTRVRVHIRLQ